MLGRDGALAPSALPNGPVGTQAEWCPSPWSLPAAKLSVGQAGQTESTPSWGPALGSSPLIQDRALPPYSVLEDLSHEASCKVSAALLQRRDTSEWET